MVEALAFVILVGLMLVPMLNVLVGAVAGAVLSGPLGAVFGLVTGYGLSVVIAKDRRRARRRRNNGRHCGQRPDSAGALQDLESSARLCCQPAELGSRCAAPTITPHGDLHSAGIRREAQTRRPLEVIQGAARGLWSRL
jgi:Permease family